MCMKEALAGFVGGVIGGLAVYGAVRYIDTHPETMKKVQKKLQECIPKKKK